jgi:hypothetical protein
MIEKVSKAITLIMAIVVTTWLTWLMAGVFLNGWVLIVASVSIPIGLVLVIDFALSKKDVEKF